VKVLLIEDNPDHAFIERKALERELDAVVTVEARPDAGLARLREGDYDVVVLDYHLPGQDGLDVLKRIREGRRDLPVILLTAAGNEEVAVQAMKQGASDYLVKRFNAKGEVELAASVRRGLEQAELTRAYRRSQDLLRKTLELAWDGVAFVSLRTRKVIAANASLSRMLGVAPGVLEGRAWEDLFDPEERAGAERLETFFDTPPPAPAGKGAERAPRFELEARLRRADATTVLAELRAVECDIEGEPCALVTARDVSEKRRLQEQLVQAQKMEAVGTLAGGIAHDFNNLLGAILGYSSYLKRHIRPGDRLYKSVETIEGASERAAELVRRLLSFSRRGPGDRHPFAPNATVEETERLLARSLPKSIKLKTDLRADVPAVDGDETEIQQVVLNVCLNARDAMREGGTLVVRTSVLRPHELPAGVVLPPENREREYVSIAIVDTGVGMTREVRDHMFEPFFTTKGPGKGTGLGLATAYAIVKAHGGAIIVESEQGRGTTVRILLPATQRAPEARRPDSAPERSGKGRILVVDDEAAIRDLTTDILEERGYDVVLASSGEEAVRLFTAERGKIDLVILDMIMPGLNGLETLKRLREVAPDIRVLLSSGYSPEGTRAEALERGAVGFIHKPYRVADLSTAVRGALSSGRG
jgi:signal transduction histidine kinase